MKDAYSFDADSEGADVSYQKMFDAYMRIFSRCGLAFRAVEADTGNIGGSSSHEFMVMADSGEDALVFCSACSYAANLEKAEVRRTPNGEEHVGSLALEKIYTPDVRSIEEVCSFLQVSPEQVVKTLIFQADQKPVAVLVRGDDEINEAKLRSYLKADSVELATDDIVLEVTGAPKGFAGAVGAHARIIADFSLLQMHDFVMGANEENYHLRNVNAGRDFKVQEYADIRFIRQTDSCPRCAAPIKFARGIEVGHVFKLGTKYSKAMRATYLDRSGQEKFMIMGCYGIGIGRTAAASIEQNHDENGIVWPLPIAPFHVIITPVNVNDDNLARAASDLYNILIEKGVDALLDDRDERAGVKFNDADLIGIPIRVTIGPKRLAEGKVELKIRKTGEVRVLPIEEARDFILESVQKETGRKCNG